MKKASDRKKRSENTQNMKATAPLMLEAIETYQISKLFLAKRLFASEWKEDKETKQLLTMRLRNKLNGTGSLKPEELEQIQNILLEMADAIRESVKQTAIHIERREKIARLLANPDMVDPKALDDILKRIE